MSDYVFTEQELNELKEVFFTEAEEILDALNQEILGLEAGQDRDSALKNIQRHLHTLKGNSRALGFTGLNALSHKAEDLLKTVQDNSLPIDQGLVDLLFRVHDALRVHGEEYRAQADVSPDTRLLEQIDFLLRESGGNGSRPVASGASASFYDVSITFDPRCDMKSPAVRLLADRLTALGEVVSADPPVDSPLLDKAEQVTLRLRTTEQPAAITDFIMVPGIVERADIRKIDGQDPRPKPEQKAASPRAEAAQMLKVDALRVDKILNLMGELVIGRSMVGQVLADLAERHKKDPLVKRLEDANAFMEKTLSQLQKNVMKIRMLPIAKIFRKFPRVVRDLSREKGKQIELVMEGEKTEIDKGLLDVIGEPLIHLVRNAIDHGIEPPDERERRGKPRAGTITLKASHEGNQIMIDVRDDGAGLDPEKFRKAAVEKGIKTPDEAGRLSDEEACDLIFLSGFSTAGAVTDISGRGLGMDIVRTTVGSLKGRIQVRSKTGEGTTFTLRLPLTLAIIRAMLFSCGGRLLALPMSTIERIARIKDGDVQTINGRNVLRYRDKVISLVSLRETLMMEGGQKGLAGNRFVIVVGLGEKLHGFGVDRLIGQQELVIKALDNHWKTLNCTSGASILGNGDVVLILDAPAVIAREMRRERAAA